MKLPSYVALATGIAVAFASSLPREVNSLVRRSNYNNWAGSVLMEKGLTLVTGSFEVPLLDNPPNGAAIAIWVGMGGALNDDKGAILQTGITIDDQNNIRAWHEWYPNLPIAFSNDLAIQPGHTLMATVQARSPTSGAVTLINTSNNRKAEYMYSDPSNDKLTFKSAEWIIEAVTDQGARRPIPGFSRVTFTDAKAFTDVGDEKNAVDGRIHDLYVNGAAKTDCQKNKLDVQCDYVDDYPPQLPPN